MAEERIWRIKEITTVSTLAGRPNFSSVERDLYCRTGATLFYAHWEGYVKRAATYYLKFLALQRVPLDEMADFLLYLYIKQSIPDGNLAPERLVSVGQTLMRNPTLRPTIKWKNRITTDSNLSSSVLRRICSELGLEYELLFGANGREIDSLILKHRNAIAHGEKGEVDLIMLVGISTLTIGLITTFRDAIENSVTLKSYKRRPVLYDSKSTGLALRNRCLESID